MLIDLDMSKGELRRRSGISSVSLAMDEIQKYHDTENLKWKNPNGDSHRLESVKKFFRKISNGDFVKMYFHAVGQ